RCYPIAVLRQFVVSSLVERGRRKSLGYRGADSRSSSHALYRYKASQNSDRVLLLAWATPATAIPRLPSVRCSAAMSRSARSLSLRGPSRLKIVNAAASCREARASVLPKEALSRREHSSRAASITPYTFNSRASAYG